MKKHGCLFMICICWLTACSTLIERQMASHTGMRGTFAPDFGQTESLHCLAEKRCVRVTDWSNLTQAGTSEPLTELKLNVDIAIDDSSLKLEEEFAFTELDESAPLVIVFPGYGMRAEHMAMMATFLRAQGMQPLVVASPTEQKPFNFGVQGARDLAVMVAERHAEREVYLLGFSLGSLAVAEFSRLHKPAGAMVIAPLLDFDYSALQLIKMRRHSSRFARIIPESSYARGLQRLLDSSEIELSTLTWAHAVDYLPDNSFVVASAHDKLSNYSELQQLVKAQGRGFNMIELTDPAYVHPILAMPLPEIQTAINQWLNVESQ